MASTVSLVSQEKRKAVALEYQKQAEEEALQKEKEEDTSETDGNVMEPAKEVIKPIIKRKAKKKDGDISRMREERRDLYDLLYGDEAEKKSSDGNDDDDLDEYGSAKEDIDTDGNLLGDASSFLRGIAT